MPRQIICGQLWDMCEEHLSEAEFLWEQWERSQASPVWTPEDVEERIEERLFGNVDGLVAGGEPVAEQLLLPILEEGQGASLGAAMYALLASNAPDRVEAVWTRFIKSSNAEQTSLARALEKLEGVPHVDDRLVSLLKETPLQPAVLDILLARGSTLGAGFHRLCSSGEAAVTAAALRACRRPGLFPGSAAIERALSSPNSEVREAAIEVGMLHGSRSAWSACREAAQANERSARALLLLGLVGGAPEHKFLLDALEVPRARPHVLFALGFTGTAEAAAACLPYMAEPRVAALAGEAFCAITGLDLGREHCVAGVSSPPDECLALKEDPDEELLPNPEDDLPMPEPEAVRAWWRRRGCDFRSDTRYLRGRPYCAEAVRSELQMGSMRRRHALALALAITTEGTLSLRLRRWVRLQRAEIVAASISEQDVRAALRIRL